MKVDVKNIGELTKQLSFEIPKDRVSQKLNEVYNDINKVAKVKGFRAGKVPRHILESHYSQLAREEVVKKLVPEVYHEGLEQENLFPIERPEIEDVSFKDGTIKFLAKFEVKPQVQVKDYKGIKVKRKPTEVTNEDINKTLEYFKKGQGTDKEVTLDDNWAHGFGYPTLEDFKKSIARQLEGDKDRQGRIDVENQVVEYLIGRIKFALPQSLVKKQLEGRLHEYEHHLREHQTKPEELEERREKMRKELVPVVERDIKVYLIFEKIAEAEGIILAEGENLPGKVMEYLLKEAQWE